MPESRFTTYILNPDHAKNRGDGGRKVDGFRQLGYDLATEEARRQALSHLEAQVRPGLADSAMRYQGKSEWGHRYLTSTPITGPNGRKATAMAAWQVDKGSRTPRILTMWAEVHTEGDSDE